MEAAARQPTIQEVRLQSIEGEIRRLEKVLENLEELSQDVLDKLMVLKLELQKTRISGG